MSTSTTEHPAYQFWGIYRADPEYARALGHPLRTVVQAPTQIVAEEIAAHLGFGDPAARLVRPDEVKRAEWLPQGRPGHRQELVQKPSRGIRI